jgi:hypothetical protein
VEWNDESTFIELYPAKPTRSGIQHIPSTTINTKYGAWEELAKALGLWNNLADCLFRKFEKVVVEWPVAKNRSGAVSLSSTGTAALYVVSFFAIFGPIKIIRNSKSAGDM